MGVATRRSRVRTAALVLATVTLGLVTTALPSSAAEGRGGGGAAVLKTAQSATTARRGFVGRSGQQLVLNGLPYRFTGMNVYNANSVNNFWYTMGTGPALDTALTQAGPGKKVIRAWFGQYLANPYGAGLDWSAFDHTLAVAKAHGYRVVVTMGSQDGSFDDGIAKGLSSGWYQSGYRTVVSPVFSPWRARNALTYKAYVGRLVARYRNDPTVLMWQLMNEPEPKPDDGVCTVAADDSAAKALRGFADDMGAYVHGLDPDHLVSLGSIGTGQCGLGGERYQYVHASPGIDLLEMHDYVAAQDIIGDQWNGMALRLQQAKALDKPLFVGEMGIDPAQVGGLEARAARFRSKLTAQFAAGVVGVLAWEWRADGVRDGDPFVFGAGDPLLAALQLGNYPRR